MRRHVYLRPLGLLPARADRLSGAVGASLPLAGGWLEATAVEQVRGVDRLRAQGDEVIAAGVVAQRPDLAPLLAPLRSVRSPVAGVTMDRPRIMGIVNLTPDSFSDGGRLGSVAAAVDHAMRLVAEGAEFLDLGAESTRPGSVAVSLDEEFDRLLPVLQAVRARSPVAISVDTRKAAVMAAAAAAGADLINDVSALTHDPAALVSAVDTGLPVVLMHAQGDPKTMQDQPRYNDVVLDVFDELEARIHACLAAGIPRDRLIVDPGIGFGKTLAHNLALMADLALFHGLGVPLLLGASRKRFIGALTGVEAAGERVAGSVGAALAAVAQGAQIIRVHDVAATRHALDVYLACLTGTGRG